MPLLSRLSLLRLTPFVSQGIFQIKYLYAEHVYEWGAEQVSAIFICCGELTKFDTIGDAR